MACKNCAHLHIMNGRYIYARCELGHALFEKYGEGRQEIAAHTCPEEKSAVEALKDQNHTRL